jgi:hypothetical protein
VCKKIQEEIENIAALCNVSLSDAAQLLRHFQWNSEALIERFFDQPEKVFLLLLL